MNSLPKDLEDIILDYKYQMEHTHKFKNTLDIIKKIQSEDDCLLVDKQYPWCSETITYSLEYGYFSCMNWNTFVEHMIRDAKVQRSKRCSECLEYMFECDC